MPDLKSIYLFCKWKLSVTFCNKKHNEKCRSYCPNLNTNWQLVVLVRNTLLVCGYIFRIFLIRRVLPTFHSCLCQRPLLRNDAFIKMYRRAFWQNISINFFFNIRPEYFWNYCCHKIKKNRHLHSPVMYIILLTNNNGQLAVCQFII